MASLSFPLRDSAAALACPLPPLTNAAAKARARRRGCSLNQWTEGRLRSPALEVATRSRRATPAAAAAAANAAASPAPPPPSSSSSWRDEVAAACADPNALGRLTLKGRLSTDDSSMPYRQATARFIALRGKPALQLSLLTARQDLTRNYKPGEEARAAVRELLGLPWHSAALALEDGGGIEVQVSRKGREVVTRRRPLPRRADSGREEEEDGPSPPQQPQPRILPSHDRAKTLPLPPDEPDPFLQRLGLQGADGRARADGRRKLAQVNALLRLLDATGAMEAEDDDDQQEEEVHVLDAGCGASVLTFGVYRHLQKKARQRAKASSRVVRLTGVDTNAALMRRSAEAARELLDPSDPPAAFLAMPIRDYGRSDGDGAGSGVAPPAPPPPPPDLVLALHACDAATDEALALAVRTRARLALAVPCCMVSMHRDYSAAAKRAAGATAKDNGGPSAELEAASKDNGGDLELQAAVARAAAGGRRKKEAAGAGANNAPPPPPPPSELPLAALLRHGILKQRLLDLATDSLRAALLRCLGYSADAVEFVSTEHTPRNLLLRSALARREWKKAANARKEGVALPPLPLDRAAVREYKAMRAFFGGIAPALEAMLERDGQLPRGWLELAEEE